MGKLLKYELKSIYKFILMVFLTIVISSTILQINIYNAATSGFGEPTGFGIFLIALAALVIWATFLVSFFYIVNSFNKELLDDRGYLTFTLPVTGRQILGSKVLASFIAFTALGLGAVIFNLILGSILVSMAGVNIFQELLILELPKGFFKFMSIMSINAIISTIFGLIVVYFVMTLRKVVFGGRKLNGMWFIFYLIISGFIAYITMRITEVFPYGIVLTESGSLAIKDIYMFDYYYAAGLPTMMNIASTLFSIVLGVILFFATSYMIDKKVEI